MEKTTLDHDTLIGISELFEAKHYVTWERFVFYYQTVFGITDKNIIKNDWKVFERFPADLYRFGEKRELIAKVLNNVVIIHKMISSGFEKSLVSFSYQKEGLKKIYYTENSQNSFILVDFYKSGDIIAYAELLKREGAVVVGVLDKWESIRVKNKQDYTDIFEGDLFCTSDNYWGDKSRVFIIKDKAARHLNYIKGKGYIDKKGNPNIDEDGPKMTSYAITGCENWIYMGNIVTDSHLLKDSPDENQSHS